MNKLILNTSFITLNEYINLERSNKFLAAKSKKAHTNKVSYLAMSFNFKLDHSKIYDVHFEWFKPSNRQDHDNIAFAKKFILDGLVVSKALKTDSPKQIRNFRDTFILDRDRNYISCIVYFDEVRKGLSSADNYFDWFCDYNNKASGVDKLHIDHKPYQNAYTRRAIRTLSQFLHNMLTPIWIRDCPYNIKGACGTEFEKYENNI